MAAKKPLVTRIKNDPALLARALRDPGLRSRLPDKYLSATQLATRKQNQYLGDIGDLSTPLQGSSLVNAAQQITKSDYAPLLANVGQQEQIVNRSAGLQGDWAKRYYGDLNGLMGSIGAQQGTANAAAVKAAQDQGAATQAAITRSDQDAQARMAQDAAVRGPGLEGDSAANQAARTATAQQNALGDSGRAATSARQFGDVQAAFLKGLQGATAQQGGEYQQQIAGAQGQALQQLAANRADLQGRQAGSLSDTLLRLRSGEQQNAITAAGLGIRQDSAAAAADASAGSGGQRYGYTPSEWLALPASTRTAIVAAANRKTPSASDKKTAADLAYFKQHGYYPPTGPPRKGRGTAADGSKPATPAAINTAQSETTSALSDAKSLTRETRDRHQLANLLLNGRPEQAVTVNQKTRDGSVSRRVVQQPAVAKHDALWTSVALDVLLDGHVSRYNAQRLHAQGLTVKDLGFPSYADSQKNSKSTAAAGRKALDAAGRAISRLPGA